MASYVLALGYFDGLHLGHTEILNRTLQVAEEKQLTPAILTFDKHPKEVLTGHPMALINTPEDREEMVSRLFGIHDFCTCHVNKDFLSMSPLAFIENLLIKNFKADYVICGHDFTFGHKGTGNAEFLKQNCQKLGIGCEVVPCVCLNDIPVSSSKIRELLEQGLMKEANAFLGHAYSFTGKVQKGKQLGRTIGFPTINLSWPKECIVPLHGVYSGKTFLEDGRELSSVTYIGTCPTVGGTDVLSETYLLNFNENLYGQKVRIELYDFQRKEEHFSSVEEMQQQEQRDIL